jgi:ribosomal 50S subunit-recycling heat shock protein
VRIDLVLKYLCLARSRSGAKALCDRGAVHVNGTEARAASMVHAGDHIELRLPERTRRIEIVAVPDRQASKSDAAKYYREAQ